MKKGLTISGVGHLSLILWALLGGWWTWTTETPPVQVAQVSLISTSAFDALTSAAPQVSDASPTPTQQPAASKTPKPAAKPEKPKPAVVTPQTPKADAPKPDAPLPDTPAVTPPADTPQPIPVPLTDKKPVPRPADRIAATPVQTTDQPKKSDQPTPAQTDTPSPDAKPAPDQTPAAPVETVTAVTPDAKPNPDPAPQLAPTESPRPAARPKPDAKPADKPAAASTAAAADTQAATDAATADQAAIDAALAAATASDTQAPSADAAQASKVATGGNGNAAAGPPMSAGELDGVRNAINKCWNVGAIASAALQVKLTLRVEMSPDGKPIYSSITMTKHSGGDDAVTQQAFEAARRAVIRSTQGCNGPGLALDPAKFATWNVMNLNFDGTGVH